MFVCGVLAEASPVCWRGRSTERTRREMSGRAGIEGGLPHDPRPVQRAFGLHGRFILLP